MTQRRDLPEDPARGQRITALMERRGKTDDEIAREAGVRPPQVRSWKRGAPMPHEAVKAVARALRVPQLVIVEAREDHPNGVSRRNLPADPERGKLITRLMDERGLTLAMLAKAVNTTARSVSNWRAGGPMHKQSLETLAKFFEISPQDLGGDLYVPPPAPAEDRRGADAMRDFGEVTRRIADLRGPDEVTLSSLREDVVALSGTTETLLLEVQKLRRQLGDSERRSTGDTSKPAPPATGSA